MRYRRDVYCFHPRYSDTLSPHSLKTLRSLLVLHTSTIMILGSGVPSQDDNLGRACEAAVSVARCSSISAADRICYALGISVVSEPPPLASVFVEVTNKTLLVVCSR